MANLKANPYLFKFLYNPHNFAMNSSEWYLMSFTHSTYASEASRTFVEYMIPIVIAITEFMQRQTHGFCPKKSSDFNNVSHRRTHIFMMYGFLKQKLHIFFTFELITRTHLRSFHLTPFDKVPYLANLRFKQIKIDDI